MRVFQLTYRVGRQTLVLQAIGANQACAEVEALGEVWEVCGDAALDKAKLVKCVVVGEAC